MRTLMRANDILKDAPQDVARDALGLGITVLVLFTGFLVPGIL